MSLKINTFVLKGFDEDQIQFLNTTIEYLSIIQQIENNIKIVENLNLSLSQDDFLILSIDELFLEQLIKNSTNKDFFLKKAYNNNQIILILDDVDIHILPEYLQYFQTFILINNEKFTDEDNEEWNATNDSKSNLFEVVNDLVHYQKRVKTSLKKEGLTIYIGPSDENTTLEYQKILRELLHRNYNILPEISNSSAKELIDNKGLLTTLLNEADLSIHFIGHKSIVNYPEKSSSAIKINELTAKFCTTPEGKKLQRIIYIPSERSEANELLSKKILQFKSDTQSLFNAELVQTPVEKFKEVVLQKLNELSKPIAHKIKTEQLIDDLYLIYPPGEEKGIKPLTDWLEKNTINFSRSQIELDQLDLLHYHQQKLKTCKGVAIFNSSNSEWLNRKLSDIKKAPGWGRQKAFNLKVIFGSNSEENSTHIDSSFIVIDNEKKLDSNQIKTLLID